MTDLTATNLRVTNLRVIRPRDVAEAVRARIAAGETARYVAGGTALQLDWAKGVPKPALLIDVSGLSCTHEVRLGDGVVRLGAGVRLSPIEADRTVATHVPLLAAAVRDVAAPGVRNRATLGGNVASRTGCLLPALLALDAHVELCDQSGVRIEPLATWLARPVRTAGLLLALRLRPQEGGAIWTHRKIGLRAGFTPSVIGVAGMLACEGGRIAALALAVGGGPNAPRRLTEAERLLTGQELSALHEVALQHRLAALIDAPTDAFRSGRYRSRIAAAALLRGLAPGDEPSPAAYTKRPAPAVAPPSVRVERSALQDRWRVRPDIAAKVSGCTAYLTDQRRPGMLVGRILLAGVPHARIRSIDSGAASALPGVVAVVTAADVDGLNAFGIMRQDQPAFCGDRVRFVGDVVAAVAAVDEETAARALRLIVVDYEALPIVDDPEAALAPGAPPVHAAGNLVAQMRHAVGDVDAAFATCTHIVEDTYVTPRQMHGFMETEGGYALPEPDGGLTVCVGGQHGARDRMQLARILALPEDAIRVVTSPIGGGFGGKDELTVQPALALLARKCGRPVRLQLDRASSVASGMKSNPMRIRMRTGCDAQGRLLAQEVDLLVDCGAYASLSPAVLETALEHVCGPYIVPNVRTLGRLAYTNNGRCGAFRGFGANQMTFALECQIGRLAERAGLDPVAIRRLNLRQPGAPGYFGHAVGPSERLHEMLGAAAASPLWRDASPAPPDALIGVGMALNHQGTGLGSVVPDDGAVRLRLREDGRIEAAYGLDEMGQGLLTAIQEIVAAALGCGRDDIVPVTGDTALAPDSGSTSAARGSFVVWQGAQEAGPPFASALRHAAAARLGRAPEDLAIVPGGLRDARSNSGALLIGFATLGAGASSGRSPAERGALCFSESGLHGRQFTLPLHVWRGARSRGGGSHDRRRARARPPPACRSRTDDRARRLSRANRGRQPAGAGLYAHRTCRNDEGRLLYRQSGQLHAALDRGCAGAHRRVRARGPRSRRRLRAAWSRRDRHRCGDAGHLRRDRGRDGRLADAHARRSRGVARCDGCGKGMNEGGCAVSFRLNGALQRLVSAPDRILLDILRESFGLTGAKPGCSIGRCGACLVLLDGAPVNACLVMAYQIEGRDVVSPEGLDAVPMARVVREALIAENSFQCGYCAPGFTVALTALLASTERVDEAAVRAALVGNICRCSGYQSIVRGALAAAERVNALRAWREPIDTDPAPGPIP